MALKHGDRNRITLYLSAELREAMRGVPVNWSATAAEAFRHKLLVIASTTGGATMTAGVERLKAAMELEADEGHQRGLADGRKWASEKASPRQLRRLDKAADDRSDFSFIGGNNEYEAATDFVRIVEDDGNLTLSDADRLLGDAADDFPNPYYAHAFAEGALEVWDAANGVPPMSPEWKAAAERMAFALNANAAERAGK